MTLTENETESSVDQQSRASDKKKYVAIAVTILLVAILTVGGVAIGISQARQAQASPSPISEGHQPADEAGAIKGNAKSAVRANIAADAPDAEIALEAAGKADAARSALATAQEAPADPNNAAGAERPSRPSADASGKGPNAEAAPPAQPSNPTSPSEPESPSPAHTCSFEPVTESAWQADGTTVTDYSKPSYVWGCNDCGITFASSDACYQHQEEHAFGHHTYSDTVYPTTQGGGYVDKPTGEYKPCPVCGAMR